MDVSIILASYNGATTLPRTLAALAALDRPAGGCEIILVDNNSTDETPRLMAAFAEEIGAIALSEPRQGKAFALNTGLDHAQGRLVVFTDDDTLPDPDWIMAYVRAAKTNPNFGIFAGEIRPCWPASPPGWLVSLTDRGMSFGCTPISTRKGPHEYTVAKGANMMARASLLADLRFNRDRLNFGGPGAMGGGEDTDFAKRASEVSGQLVYFLPNATVQHIIRPDEMTLRTVFERYMRIGAGQAVVQHYTRLSVAGTIVRSFALIVIYTLTFQRDRTIGQIVTLASQIGRLNALMRP